MLDDVEILLDFVLDYGSKGLLPNMDEGGSGDIAYEAALRLKEVTPERTKQETLAALTNLYYVCVNSGWSRMADVISTAEDVARQEVNHARYPSLPEDWDECVEAVMNTDLEKEIADDPL